MLRTMTKSFITTLLMLFALSLPQQLSAELYKWTDELGRIHFTDTPPEGAKAKSIDIGPLNTYNSPSESSIKRHTVEANRGHGQEAQGYSLLNHLVRLLQKSKKMVTPEKNCLQRV